MIRSPAQGQPRFPHENILRFSDEQAGLIAIVSIHRPLHGVAMGGTRLLPYGCEEDAVADALRLSEAMTLKAACAGLPVGGAKAVIIAAPAAKTEALLRSYARFIESLRGRFITGQDMNVTADDVRTMAQETRFIVGIGGASEGPAAMTARGVFAGLRGALRVRHGATSFAGVKVAIQGVGAVGARLAEFLVDQGAEVVVADLDQARAADVAARLGARVAPVALIHLEDVDIFAPCGRGGSISNQVIPLLKATIVGGAANNQLVDEAGGSFLLKRRGIAYCPDFVINAYPMETTRIPMFDARVRSLNLANAVSIAVYEAMRQLGV